jgi:transcriptional regulator with PAS, ATPase and Fis domain
LIHSHFAITPTPLADVIKKGSSTVEGIPDSHHAFSITEKLYGREKEIDTIVSLCREIAFLGKILLLVSGYSGVGKSALLHEVHKPSIETRSPSFIPH